ncbi:hypothetical protein CTAYLR_008323 [Chrysophaeum taylorii]|uniref:Fe-S metabolism associated domain-containing protein n=1 Tax=Chrysophaeum taylorii TaxID=2483200 RepID=A0AAD7UA85_9STRA|nr:hypothetical protein CTAYLR_008323 [Chrysophaeum taylorii]
MLLLLFWLAGVVSGFVVAPSPRARGTHLWAAVEASSELPPALAGLVESLAKLPDDKFRYKQLLYWAAECPPMAPELKAPENKVPGCLSTVHIDARLERDGTVSFSGDSDAQLTKGLVTLLVKGLSGSTPDAIAKVDPSFIRTAGIAASLTPGRTNGFMNMLAVMQNKASSLRPADDESTTAGTTTQRGPRARAMLEKLQMLQPSSIELEDESDQHAGHAGARGAGGESHFALRIVASCFEDLPRVKRHQLIYALLGEDLMPHALSITAQTPSEHARA